MYEKEKSKKKVFEKEKDVCLTLSHPCCRSDPPSENVPAASHLSPSPPSSLLRALRVDDEDDCRGRPMQTRGYVRTVER